MPLYQFIREDDGKEFELEMGKEELVDAMVDDTGLIRLPDGTMVRRVPIGSTGIGANTQAPGAWPQESLAFGCFPEEVDNFRKYYRERGVNMDFKRREENTMVAVFNGRGQRKAADKARGWIDKDAGYGDAS